MKARKTVAIADLRNLVNTANAHGTQTREQRQGHNMLLDSALHLSGNYRGFRYLQVHEVPAGRAPGIVFDSSEDHDHEYPDDSRRYYN